MTETRRKIIEAAECEFAERGYGGASIRGITQRAGVNVAAISYHFGNKQTLFKEMARYRIEPINQLRLRLLNEAQASEGSRPLSLERIVDIIVRPLFEALMSKESEDFRFMRAVGRGLSESQDFMKDLHRDILKEVIPAFSRALSDALGHPKPDQMAYGMHLLSSTLCGSMLQHPNLEFMSQGRVDLRDVDALAGNLVAFLSGGLRRVCESNERESPR